MFLLRNACFNYEDGDRIHPAEDMTERWAFGYSVKNFRFS